MITGPATTSAAKSRQGALQWLVAVFLSVICVPTGIDTTWAEVADGAFSGTLTLHEGKLTGRLAAEPLQKVMERLHQLSGAQILGLTPEEGQERISVELNDVSLQEALSRILVGKNFMLFYAPTKGAPALTQIWIGGKKTTPSTGSPSQLTAAGQLTSDGTQAKATEEDEDIGSQSVEQLMGKALQQTDASTRLMAIAYLGAYAQEDGRVQETLQLLAKDSDPQVQEAAAAVLAGIVSETEGTE